LDTERWAAQLDELQDGIAAMRRFFDGRDTATPLTAQEMSSLERLFDRYLDADQAVAAEVERLLQRDTKRPRR
jgi:hypothetical protein